MLLYLYNKHYKNTCESSPDCGSKVTAKFFTTQIYFFILFSVFISFSYMCDGTYLLKKFNKLLKNFNNVPHGTTISKIYRYLNNYKTSLSYVCTHAYMRYICGHLEICRFCLFLGDLSALNTEGGKMYYLKK
jgi:hypothetical protein